LVRNQDNVYPQTCFSEQALWNPTNYVGLVQSRPHYHLIENYLVLAMI
jgi:hypothetical protein